MNIQGAAAVLGQYGYAQVAQQGPEVMFQIPSKQDEVLVMNSETGAWDIRGRVQPSHFEKPFMQAIINGDSLDSFLYYFGQPIKGK